MKRISKILIFGRDIEDTAVLYTMALGMKILMQSSYFLELTDNSQHLVFYRVESFAQSSKGYSPILWFNVSEFEETCSTMIKYGAKQEGNTTVTDQMTVALFQGINGEMIAISKGEETQEETLTQKKDDELLTEMKALLGRLKI